MSSRNNARFHTQTHTICRGRIGCIPPVLGRTQFAVDKLYVPRDTGDVSNCRRTCPGSRGCLLELLAKQYKLLESQLKKDP